MVIAALSLWGMSNWIRPIVVTSSDTPPAQSNILAQAGLSMGMCRIQVYDKFHEEVEDWQIVMDHEVGHCLGLNHIPQPGIMYPALGPDTQMTIYDWVEFWHHYPLPYQLRAPMLTQE